MVFMKKRLSMCRKPLEEPKVNEAPRVAGCKGGEIKKRERERGWSNRKKAIQKEIKIKPKRAPPVRVQKRWSHKRSIYKVR